MAGKNLLLDCGRCTAVGDLEKCVNTTCSKHDSWFAVELQRLLKCSQGTPSEQDQKNLALFRK